MSWSQTTSWSLVLIGITALLFGLLSPHGARIGTFSRRRFFAVIGVASVVLAGAIFVGVTIFFSLRAMPV